MQISTRKKGGPLCLAWPSRAGGSVSRATPGTIPISPKIRSRHLQAKSLRKYSIGQSKLLVMSWLMCCPSDIAKPMSALWMVLHSSRRLTGNRSRSAPLVSENSLFTLGLKDKKYIGIKSLERFSNSWIIMIETQTSQEKSEFSKNLSQNLKKFKRKNSLLKY